MSVPIEPTPATLEEAVERICTHLNNDDRAAFVNMFGWLHHSFGQALRNGWGLWNGSVLKDHFMERFGLGHADDMSGIILDSVRAKILNREFDVEAAAAKYRAYWPDNYGIDALTQKPIPGHPKARK